MHDFAVVPQTRNILLTVNAPDSILKLANFIGAGSFRLDVIRFDLGEFQRIDYTYASIPSDRMIGVLLRHLRGVEQFVAQLATDSEYSST